MTVKPIPHLLTPAEVAHLFRVGPRQVTRWHEAGLLSAVRTPAKTRRFRTAEVVALFVDCGGDEATALAILGGAQ